jgi:hypothetical protein
MYKLKELDGVTIAIERNTDGCCIPLDEKNKDYIEYLAWVAEGNTPEPAETPEEIATREQQETNASAIAYLAETDWYLLRELDGGTAMTAKMKAERAKRRLEVI